MKIRSKSIHIYTNCEEDNKIEEILDKELEEIQDYQLVGITETILNYHYHYTVFYKSEDEKPKNQSPFEIWEKHKHNSSTANYTGSFHYDK